VDRQARNILILGILVLVILAVGYYFLFLSPKLEQLDQADQERADKQGQLAQLQQEVQDLEQIRNNAPEVERQILELSKRIPAEPEIASLTVQIEEISIASDVTQLLLQPGAPTGPPEGTAGDFSRVPITMSFEGTYDELQDFLFRTRNLARLMTVNEVTYEPVEPEGEDEPSATAEVERLLQVEIQAEVYFQSSDKPDRAAPVAPAPVEPEVEVTEETTASGVADE